MKEHWVVIENGSPAEYGLLSLCAKLSQGDAQVAALLREGCEPARAFACGANLVYCLHGALDAAQAGEQIARLSASRNPEAILYAADPRGRMIAAFVAAKLHTGLAADCTELRRREDGLFLMTRPAFGGSLFADIVCPEHRPQMATVRPGVYLPSVRPYDGNGAVIDVKAPDTAATVRLLASAVSQAQTLPLAKIIVAGGKGVGSREGFSLLGKLAEALGGTLGASRAAVGAGYAPYQRQVGLTGQTVRPELYLAFGISGAVQHIVGMERSATVLAVNSDPNAPIFEYSDYGVVGDWRESAEALLAQFTIEK